MGKYLNGSAQTGAKISKNRELFSYLFQNKESNENSPILYHFTWNFDGQFGHIGIAVKDDKISNSSLIDTDSKSPHQFGRPLGLYNDSSLLPVFEEMLASINVNTNGVYAG